jgi:hypothetical protein
MIATVCGAGRLRFESLRFGLLVPLSERSRAPRRPDRNNVGVRTGTIPVIGS